MSRRFVELYRQSVVCTLLDEFFGVTKASSGKRDGGGLRQHIEPMGVKLRLIAEQVSFPDSFEKSRQRLTRGQTISVEHRSGDPSHTLTGGVPGICIPRPFRGRSDQTGIRIHRAVFTEHRPTDFGRKAGAAQARRFQVDESDLRHSDGLTFAHHCSALGGVQGQVGFTVPNFAAMWIGCGIWVSACR